MRTLDDVLRWPALGRRQGRAAGARRTRVVSSLVLAAAIVGVAGVAGPPAGASTQSVTNCKDSGTGSLRQAVAGAASGDVVSFALSPSCSIITLTSTIPIATDITIKGSGAASLAVNVSIHTTAFTVASGVTATISGLTIENGGTGIVNAGTLTLSGSTVLDNTSPTGGGIVNTGTLTVTGSTLSKNAAGVPAEGGGAIDNDGGTVVVSDSTLSDNTASGGNNGGGIYNNGGSLTVIDSTLSGNSTTGGTGGGIVNVGGTTTISSSTLADNSALEGPGGGIDNSSGTVMVTDSTLARNNAYYSVGGGGIYNEATTEIQDSTLFGNSATYGGAGGGIFNTGTLTIAASTLAHNSAADSGGGIYGPATVGTSILALNTEGDDCATTVTDAGYNLADDSSCGFTASSDVRGEAAGLAPGGLSDNGGPTKTVALEEWSPAVGAVTNAGACSTPDQRGVTRPTPCDIGSVQLALPPQTITSPDSATASVGTFFSFTVTTSGVPLPSITKTGTLPKHLKIVKGTDGTAVISGTPAKAGTDAFTLRATYGKGGTKTVVTQAFTLTVTSPT